MADLEALDLERLFHPNTKLAAYHRSGPLVLSRGEGIFVWDNHGKRYIEGMAGSTQVNLMYHAARRREAETVAQLIRIDNPGVSATDEMLVQVALALNGATTAIAVQWMMGSYQTSQDLIVASCERMVRGIMRELLQSPAAG